MATTYTWNVGSGLWSVPGNWTPTGNPGQTGTTDAVVISSTGPLTVTYDPSSATIGSLSISGTNDTLSMDGSNNTLEIDLTGNIGQGLLAGTNNTLAMTGTNQTLTIDLGGSSYYQSLVTGAGDVLAIGGVGNKLDVTNSVGGQIVVAAGKVTLAGGSFDASGAYLRLNQGATISGYGSLSAKQILYQGSYGGKITAVGGTLDVSVSNGVSPQILLGIDDVAGGDLTISGTAVQDNALTLDNTNQTLEIASDGHLQMGTLQSITNATVRLDGGNASYYNTYGVNLDTGAQLNGAGTVTIGGSAGIDFHGAGTVTASSSTLTFSGAVDLTGSATSFKIDSGATLAFLGLVGTSGAGGIAPTIDFVKGGSAIETMDLSATYGTSAQAQFYGVVQDFYKYSYGSDQMLVGGSATGNQLFVTDSNGNIFGGGDETGFTYVTVKDASGNLVDRIDMGSYTSAQSVGFLNQTARTTLTTTETYICFMPGTMIRTPDGEVAVETLKRGDLVLTSDGLAQPVRWLGRQTVSTRFADPLRVLPIRIKAGALAENVPARDLLLSPDHAVLVDGALIHAGALVNGASILRETAVPEIFTYYHVELDDHSLVLAENTPAETFVDNVERLAFDNWAEHEALYPEGKSIAELPYPRAKGRRQVPVYVRVLLAERAEIIGASTPAAMVA